MTDQSNTLKNKGNHAKIREKVHISEGFVNFTGIDIFFHLTVIPIKQDQEFIIALIIDSYNLLFYSQPLRRSGDHTQGFSRYDLNSVGNIILQYLKI